MYYLSARPNVTRRGFVMSVALDVRRFVTLPGEFCAGLFMPFTLRLTTLASDKGVVTAIESRALIPGDFATGATVVSSLSCLTIELRRRTVIGWPDGYSMRKERVRRPKKSSAIAFPLMFRSLVLNQNPLRELDPSVEQLHKLRVLGIAQTEITKLPQ